MRAHSCATSGPSPTKARRAGTEHPAQGGGLPGKEVAIDTRSVRALGVGQPGRRYAEYPVAFNRIPQRDRRRLLHSAARPPVDFQRTLGVQAPLGVATWHRALEAAQEP